MENQNLNNISPAYSSNQNVPQQQIQYPVQVQQKSNTGKWIIGCLIAIIVITLCGCSLACIFSAQISDYALNNASTTVDKSKYTSMNSGGFEQKTLTDDQLTILENGGKVKFEYTEEEIGQLLFDDFVPNTIINNNIKNPLYVLLEKDKLSFLIDSQVILEENANPNEELLYLQIDMKPNSSKNALEVEKISTGNSFVDTLLGSLLEDFKSELNTKLSESFTSDVHNWQNLEISENKFSFEITKK